MNAEHVRIDQLAKGDLLIEGAISWDVLEVVAATEPGWCWLVLRGTGNARPIQRCYPRAFTVCRLWRAAVAA